MQPIFIQLQYVHTYNGIQYVSSALGYRREYFVIRQYNRELLKSAGADSAGDQRSVRGGMGHAYRFTTRFFAFSLHHYSLISI